MIDPATNMPVLPEGQYWEVVKAYHGYPTVGVTVMLREDTTSHTRVWWVFPVRVTVPRTLGLQEVPSMVTRTLPGAKSGGLLDEKTPVTPERVQGAAVKIMERIQRREAERAQLEAVLGKYPPKRLGVGE